ncbi:MULTISPECIES: virulence factor SrfB [Methylococcus]|uniref:Virulence factor SrfB n=1 Tax=Methylococcus capsulatus TaxID=414 RepID=A0ABZ2F5E7_METCP|nr:MULTISPECIES: virulence factor SrfB [Methylococcus]MDF9393507.1 virulence factor SrfB [Methylococcus capsulatus]
MLSELVEFAEKATLIMRSGVQFMDFGLTLDLRREPPGEFALQSGQRSLARLEWDERRERHVHPADPMLVVKPRFSVSIAESVKLLGGCWLPLPMLRAGPQRRFDQGPTTWARARIVELGAGEDLYGHTHRLTLAFDTQVLEAREATAYLAPTRADVQTGASFQLAHRAHEMGWYPEQPWVDEWLAEVFRDEAAERLKLPAEDVDSEIEQLSHHAHYLNFLHLIGTRAGIPEIRLRSNAPDDVYAPIPVDLVLDVGNSRTCGILVEEHPQQHDGLKNRYELTIRDLSEPHKVYHEPFESRVEFAQALLGKEHLACKSGRNDAFVWPTIARVGREAARLANHRRGTEGSTGLSSPKRYLWDEDRYEPGWRFNAAYSREEIEPHATGAPFSNLINERGEALHELPEGDRMPVFVPKYSRSALMCFFLAEILVHALGQINSPAQRIKQGDPEKPRHLRSIIITVPPSMPKPERQIFAARLRQAMALVWKALGWHPEDDDIAAVDAAGNPTAWPRFPAIHTEWDEATAAQAVYLFSEIHEHFGGRPEEFFRILRRNGSDRAGQGITVASIDIGGGTTDLVVADYRLDHGQGANVYILPEQRFRDGFKVAGDDLLLEMVQKTIVPAIEAALQDFGVADPAPLLSLLIGAETLSVQDRTSRQRLALEVFYPLGLKLLHAYERFDPSLPAESNSFRIGELLVGDDRPSEHVVQHFALGVKRSVGAREKDFDLLEVRIPFDLHRLHRLFLEDQFEICKTIRALCEIVHLYHCDVLLLSGRPSCLPGVLALFRRLLPLPPDRIVPLAGFRAGVWYPFHRDGRIGDPKTTAVVGAMICKVGGARRIPNFSFLAHAYRVYSTVRHLGLIDQHLVLRDADVYYHDINLDDENYELSEQPFELRARMILGFRQLASERWPATPLYVLDLSDRAKRLLASADRTEPAVVHVVLKLDRKKGAGPESFSVASAITSQGTALNPARDIVLKLNTLTTVGIGESSYWLDTGSIIR